MIDNENTNFGEIINIIDITEEISRLLSANQHINNISLKYKLYYDADGSVITYTTDDLDGNYIEITKEQYAEARMDVKIVSGKLVYTHFKSHVFKLEKNNDEGTKCSKYDVSIISESSDERDFSYWKLTPNKIILYH